MVNVGEIFPYIGCYGFRKPPEHVVVSTITAPTHLWHEELLYWSCHKFDLEVNIVLLYLTNAQNRSILGGISQHYTNSPMWNPCTSHQFHTLVSIKTSTLRMLWPTRTRCLVSGLLFCQSPGEVLILGIVPHSQDANASHNQNLHIFPRIPLNFIHLPLSLRVSKVNLRFGKVARSWLSCVS